MESSLLRAIEDAISALGRQDPTLARAAMSVVETGGSEVGAALDAIVVAAAELESEGEISPGTWNALADAVPSELSGLVEASRV